MQTRRVQWSPAQLHHGEAQNVAAPQRTGERSYLGAVKRSRRFCHAVQRSAEPTPEHKAEHQM
jgi:hypothetical protein